jgi:hypothetical protein
VLVGHHRDHPAGEGQLDLRADQMPVPLVVRVDGHGRVPEHRLGAGGGDDDRVVTLPVADGDQLALVVRVLDLDVRERGEAARAPVDDPLGPVDEAVLEQALEDRLDGTGQAVVEREPLPLPRHAVTEAAHLAEDAAAVLGLPLPDALHELLPAQVVAGFALADQLPLHHVLGGDAGVVHARQPQRLVALHAAAAGEHVHDRVVECVSHMETAGDVRRGQHDAELRLVAGRVRSEEAGVHPSLVQLRLYGSRLPGRR